MQNVSLTSPDILIVFAQAQAGLGHLRVTDALYHGLPNGTHPVLLNSQDQSVTYIHAIASRHIVGRWLAEAIQRGWTEDAFTHVYRWFLQRQTKTLWEQIRTMIDERISHPKTLLVVATHFGLAHQISSIKEEIAKVYGIRVLLVVVVTDDTPIKLWAVSGADRIFVPSEETKKKLEAYHRSQSSLAPATYVAAPYMVSPRLTAALSAAHARDRQTQLVSAADVDIHMAIPVSGAAVQLSYLDVFMKALSDGEPRTQFHIVSLQMPVTSQFLARHMGRQNVELLVSTNPKVVIDLYEKLYYTYVIALEVTKPSEQAFKALITPKKRGGAILLFSDPVGRQEWDNLAFLKRHALLPSDGMQNVLWRLAQKNEIPGEEVVKQARKWRALRLPSDPGQSALFVIWCRRVGLFAAMGAFSGYQDHPELADNGVEVFWKYIEGHLGEGKISS